MGLLRVHVNSSEDGGCNAVMELFVAGKPYQRLVLTEPSRAALAKALRREYEIEWRGPEMDAGLAVCGEIEVDETLASLNASAGRSAHDANLGAAFRA